MPDSAVSFACVLCYLGQDSQTPSFSLMHRFEVSVAEYHDHGLHEAGIQDCMIVVSQFVQGLVWSNSCNRMDVEIPSGRAANNGDGS